MFNHPLLLWPAEVRGPRCNLPWHTVTDPHRLPAEEGTDVADPRPVLGGPWGLSKASPSQEEGKEPGGSPHPCATYTWGCLTPGSHMGGT